VAFDPGKEVFKIIHPELGEDAEFRFLGTLVDCRLTMVPCIDGIISKIRPKIKALLRMRGTYSLVSMLNQFRTHIWCHMEYSQGALILASASQLERLDKIQRQFLGSLRFV